MDKVKVVISDCHLSAGKFFEGKLNPHEDFKFDDELCDLIDFFSTSFYGDGPDGAVDVELFINGDFFDFLNVPYYGEFEDAVTEPISLAKAEAIIAGHPKVMAALKRFVSKPGKKISYLVGNHDADLFFPKVRERITREWDPEGNFPSEKVEIIADRDRVRLEGGIEIRHGNQFEAMNEMNFENPTSTSFLDEPILNLPWGSFYVLKIVNRLKWEREHIHRVRPVKVFVLIGLLTDPWFTLKYVFLSAYYFIQTRFFSNRRMASLMQTVGILKQETSLFQDLEKEARNLLDEQPGIRTVIFGHTHRPMNKIYPDGKQYLNTGTWTQMINLDWVTLGQQFCLTFALIRIRDDGQARCELRQWVGEQGPHRGYHY